MNSYGRLFMQICKKKNVGLPFQEQTFIKAVIASNKFFLKPQFANFYDNGLQQPKLKSNINTFGSYLEGSFKLRQ